MYLLDSDCHTTIAPSAGTHGSLHAILVAAVAACPRSVNLWLMRAEEFTLAGDVAAARGALEDAHAHNPHSEDIVLAAWRLEFENGEPERARAIALRAKETLPAPTARVWMKAAIAARELGDAKVRKA
jgi:pre-mRNA-processing factor 6